MLELVTFGESDDGRPLPAGPLACTEAGLTNTGAAGGFLDCWGDEGGRDDEADALVNGANDGGRSASVRPEGPWVAVGAWRTGSGDGGGGGGFSLGEGGSGGGGGGSKEGGGSGGAVGGAGEATAAGLPLPALNAPQPFAPTATPAPAVPGAGAASDRAFLALGTLMPAAFIDFCSSFSSRRRSFSRRSEAVAEPEVDARCASLSAFRRTTW